MWLIIVWDILRYWIKYKVISVFRGGFFVKRSVYEIFPLSSLWGLFRLHPNNKKTQWP
jgi:hypothetical protein